MKQYTIEDWGIDFLGKPKLTDSAKLSNEFNKILDDHGGLDIFAWTAQDKLQNPGPYELWNGAAELGGIKAANTFLNTMYASTPEGEKKMQDFITKFDSDPDKVKQYYISEARRLMNARQPIIMNIAHENNLFSKLQFYSEGDYQLGAKLRALMKLKWQAVGYEGDNALLGAFISSLPFSKDPRPHFIDRTTGAAEIDPWFGFTRPSAPGVLNNR